MIDLFQKAARFFKGQRCRLIFYPPLPAERANPQLPTLSAMLHVVIITLTSSVLASQAELFGTPSPAAEPDVDTAGCPVSYEPIPVGRSTFKDGLSESVHSWFRLTPSFGPDLVRTIIREMGIKPGAHLHDPFSGAGTTAIEASLEGFRASCLEINPFLHFVGKTCLHWDIAAESGCESLERIKDAISLPETLPIWRT